MKKKNLFDKILDIILALLSILVIYWALELIFGRSPGLSEFNSALIVLAAGIIAKINGEVGEVKVGMKHSFDKIKEDTNLIKKKLKI